MDARLDRKQTGRGLTRLLNRYQRRANALREDADFREAIDFMRTGWNGIYPQYVGDRRDNTALETFPRMPSPLRQDLARIDSWEQAVQGHPEIVLARNRWVEMVNGLESLFWPAEDFTSPLRYGGAVTAEFVAACILYGATALPHDVPTYFPDRDELVWLMVVESAYFGSTITVPLHADMNDEDIDAFKHFVDAVRQQHFDTTASAAIDRLRALGASDNEIAKRLGFPRSSVNEHPPT